MNIRMIRYILGQVMVIVGALILLPCFVSIYYKESIGLYYLAIALGSIGLGFLVSWKKPENTVIYMKEGCVATALSWIVMSIIGSLPFVITGEIPSFTDAVFETVSGFTTTGASILTDVEAMSKTGLFWRSLTHLIGGMGVLVFLMAVIPMSGGSNINLMKAESPGPTVGKLVPKMKRTARILYIIYLAMTLLEAILLVCGGYTVFDALCTSFATAGTGGFGIYNSSIGNFTIYGKWVVTIFMILFGVNFNFYYFLLMKQFKKAFSMEEIRGYIIIILISTGIIAWNIHYAYANLGLTITDSAFQVASIITTTGFSTTDFDMWPTVSKFILFLLMFIGACAGSTGGGIKVSRFQILFKTVKSELNAYIHPKNIKKIQSDGKVIEQDTIRNVNVYIVTFLAIYFISVFIISFEGYDFTTVFTSVAATINNIGPGLSMVGPTQNFAHFSVVSKLVFIFDMLAGRLELFPILIMFHPALWKSLIEDTFTKKKARF